MGQICSRSTLRLLVALLLSGLVQGWAQGQAPAPPTPPLTPAPGPSAAPSPTQTANPTLAPGKPASPTVETPVPADKVVLKVGDQQFTKADIDSVIEILPPQTQQAIAAQGKKQFGDYYTLTLLLSKRAQLHHLDQTPEFARKLAFQKQQLEAQSEMTELTKLTPEEIQQYYTAHSDNYDEIMVRQILIRKKPPEPKPKEETPAAETPPPTVRLSWVGAGDAIVRAQLEKNPKVSGLTVQNVQAEFKYAGSDEELSALMGELFSAGVKVSNFNENKAPRPFSPMGPPGLTPDEAKARAEAIRKELIAGVDIKKLTEEFKGPDTNIEPEPRKVRRGAMRADMEKVAFGLKDGEVSEPVDTPQALVIFQVTGHSHVDLKDVTPEIERKVRQEKADAAVVEVKKNTTLWMDDQYFAAPPKPPAPAIPGGPALRMPPRP